MNGVDESHVLAESIGKKMEEGNLEHHRKTPDEEVQ